MFHYFRMLLPQVFFLLSPTWSSPKMLEMKLPKLLAMLLGVFGVAIPGSLEGTILWSVGLHSSGNVEMAKFDCS